MLPVRSVVLCVLAVVASTQGANILGIYSDLFPSHLIIHMSTAKALAEAGHNVTVVTTIQPKVMHKDIHLIVVPVTEEQERTLGKAMAIMAGNKNDVISTRYLLLNELDVMIRNQADLLSDPRFLSIYQTKFDLLILGSFYNDFQLGVAAKLKVPVIVDWMIPSNNVIDGFVANPSEISYVPNACTYASAPMSILKRAENLANHLILNYLTRRFDYKFTRIYNEIFTERDFPTLKEMKKNISLIFVGSHLISDRPIRPLVPAIVEIGGIQVKETPDPLPTDIDQFLERSTMGAIFVSFGSNIKSHMLKPEIVQIMFTVLSGLKQNIIWKWEDLEKTPGNASNILYKDWLPQDDILAHPNTKLFVNHAGKNSVTESQYHGVPMVAMPIFGDHPVNAAILVQSGYGVALDLLTITEDGFGKAINEVLGNEKYGHAVRKFSALYRDRPQTPRQSVVFWTEYVLRHHGAPHLQSPAVHMSFIELHNLDIYALFVAILVLLALLARLVGIYVGIWYLKIKVFKTKKLI
ncbi:UDP-glucosyltransferase 2-like [Drosophila rhopaloa]|uniref:UDP-glucuronosyltransferase 1-5-like n=1 Tax=Drosophila rhopaloa TaxID=1041015 RepID=A0A6P4DVQ1_DRORH|nr:UDP-glucosyltransferase 2-like [Drosophila rhopaloa]